MRRALPIATALAALMLAAPGAALASHGHRHHHHNRRAHHAKVRFEHIGPVLTGTTPGPQTRTPPAAPATPPAPENAGTVTSYTEGVLTLKLADGSSVSGKVTSETRIECVSATPPPSPADDDGGAPGDDNGPGDDQSEGDANLQGGPPQPAPMTARDDSWSGEGGEGDDGGGPPVPAATPEPPCDSSALVANAVVRAAELRIGPGGTDFESIVLVR